jgi:hypothetical protein
MSGMETIKNTIIHADCREYLEWFSKNAYHQMKNRRQWAIDELKRRDRIKAQNK